MKALIRGLLTSKKFVAAVASMLAAALMKLGLDVDTETVLTVISPVIAYIIGQGLSDLGHGVASNGN